MYTEEEDMEKTLNQASQAVRDAEQMSLYGFERPEKREGNGVKIVDFLHRDPGLKITNAALAAATGLHERTVRAAIRRAIIDDHVPIVSDNAEGHWIASAIYERDAGVRDLRSRAAEINARADALARCPIDEGVR